MKDPNDKKKWIVNEEAAEVVKRIFDLCVAGKGPMQPAIVDRNVFERVQELRTNKRRPAKQVERQGMFSGLLYCADCGSKLHFATGKNMTPEQDYYHYARYKSNTGDCTMHFIREETLKRFVLCRIFDVTAMFFEDIMSFQKAV